MKYLQLFEMDPRLLEYIKNNFNQGIPVQKIEADLLKNGWSKEQIETAIKAHDSSQNTQEVSAQGQKESKLSEKLPIKNNFHLILISTFWLVLSYFFVLIFWNSNFIFKNNLERFEIEPIFIPFYYYFFTSQLFQNGINLFVFLVDLVILLPLLALSILSIFHKLIRNILFVLTLISLILFSFLTFLLFMQKCEGLGCIGQGLFSFIEISIILIAAATLPAIIGLRKGIVSLKETWLQGFIVFFAVIIIGIVATSPYLIKGIGEIKKEKGVQKELNINENPTLPNNPKIDKTYARGTSFIIQYSNKVNLEIGPLGTNKGFLSYQIARKVIDGIDKEGFAKNPDYLLQEKIINNMVVTYFRSQNPAGDFASYDVFFTLGNKDYLVRYAEDTAKGLTEEEFLKTIEAVINFYK